MPGNDGYPDPTTPFLSEGDLIRHVGSPYYANDSHFRAMCEAKMSLGIPGASTRDTSELQGRHDIIPEGAVEEAAAEEAQHQGGLTIGGVARVTFPPGETVKAIGEAAQRRAAAADTQSQQ
jgi:hypothetical protein